MYKLSHSFQWGRNVPPIFLYVGLVWSSTRMIKELQNPTSPRNTHKHCCFNPLRERKRGWQIINTCRAGKFLLKRHLLQKFVEQNEKLFFLEGEEACISFNERITGLFYHWQHWNLYLLAVLEGTSHFDWKIVFCFKYLQWFPWLMPHRSVADRVICSQPFWFVNLSLFCPCFFLSAAPGCWVFLWPRLHVQHASIACWPYVSLFVV